MLAVVIYPRALRARRPEPFSQATSRSENCELGRRRHAGPHSCRRWRSALELLTINLEREYYVVSTAADGFEVLRK